MGLRRRQLMVAYWVTVQVLCSCGGVVFGAALAVPESGGGLGDARWGSGWRWVEAGGLGCYIDRQF